MPTKLLLEVTRGPMQGTSFQFDSHDTFLLGRRSHCHCQIDDAYVSRHQFILEANPPAARLRDLGSLHGTIVNSRKYGGRDPRKPPSDELKEQFPFVDLQDGDHITVGETEMLLHVVSIIVCGGCGKELPEESVPDLHGTAMVRVCDECRLSEKRSPQPDHQIVSRRCELCGKDLSREPDNESPHDSMCGACHRKSRPEPGGIRRWLQFDKWWNPGRPGKGPETSTGYEIVAELGKGTMGIVYKARRRSDGQWVALKKMLAHVGVEEGARRLFEREVEIMCRLKHGNIVELFESNSANDDLYFVMHYCCGGNLEGLMHSHGGRIPYRVAVPLLLQCLDGLQFAHEAEIVHRDLKPANILLDGSAADATAKIGDMGLSKCFDEAGLSGFTITGTPGGTPYFMPRDQLIDFKRARPVSDVWSMAASFYNAMTGKLPLEFFANRDWIEVLLNDDPIPICARDSTIPKDLGRVIDRALAVDSERRYQTAAEMKAALLEVIPAGHPCRTPAR